MASSPPALSEIVSRIGDIERRLDRIAAGRVLSAPVGNADIGSGIAVTKLAPGGVAQRVLGTHDGVNVAWQQVTTPMIAPANITTALVAAGNITSALIASGAISRFSLNGISTGPFFASGSTDSVLFSGGSSPQFVTGPEVGMMVLIGMIRYHMNAPAVNLTGYLGLNGTIAGEMGTWTCPTAGYFQTVSASIITNATPNALHVLGLWVVSGAGNLVTFDTGYGVLMELKR